MKTLLTRLLPVICVSVCISVASAADVAAVAATEETSFRTQIAPILLDNCVACHGAKKAEGGYRIDNFEHLITAGDSGAPPVTAGKLEESELWRRVITPDHQERMPADSEPLTAAELELLKNWISSGAKFDGERVADSLLLVMPPIVFADPPEKYARPLPITGLTFNGDGTQVITGGYHELLCWSTADGELRRRIKNVGERTFALAMHPNGMQLAVACGTPGKSGEVRIMDWSTGALLHVCARSSDSILGLAFCPDGQRLATAGADGLIRIIDATNYRELKVIASHADWVNTVAWSDDGLRLASGSRDKSAKVYMAESGDLIASYAGHGASVSGVSFLPDGLQVLSVGGDKKMHRWEVEAAKKIAEIAIGGEAFHIAVGTDFAIVPSADKQLHRIDLKKNQNVQKYGGHQDWAIRAAIHVGSNQILSGSYDGEIRLWNLADGTPIRTWLAAP
jgi:WD40 repeat protein/mono/diheme cytochrome c family protein